MKPKLNAMVTTIDTVFGEEKPRSMMKYTIPTVKHGGGSLMFLAGVNYSCTDFDPCPLTIVHDVTELLFWGFSAFTGRLPSVVFFPSSGHSKLLAMPNVSEIHLIHVSPPFSFRMACSLVFMFVHFSSWSILVVALTAVFTGESQSLI